MLSFAIDTLLALNEMVGPPRKKGWTLPVRETRPEKKEPMTLTEVDPCWPGVRAKLFGETIRAKSGTWKMALR